MPQLWKAVRRRSSRKGNPCSLSLLREWTGTGICCWMETPSYSFIPDPHVVDSTGPGVSTNTPGKRGGFRPCSLSILKGELVHRQKAVFP